MAQITLKPFQETAIAKLKNKFLKLWEDPDLGKNIVFKSPTGSGKTLMMAEFLRDMTADPRFSNADVAYIWITNSDDLAMQSKGKLWNYYDGAGEITLLTTADVSDKRLLRNGVMFINWQKLVQSRVNMRPLILRTESESNTTFDEYMANTHEAGRAVVLIIDEEHIASGTVLANDLVNNVIRPRIIIGVSATPQTVGALVEVKREDVVSVGLIKEKTVFQTTEDLNATHESDEDRVLLELAYNKREELVRLYAAIVLADKVNPLVLIQLPNEDVANKETNATSKVDIVKGFLKSKGVPDNDIAVWLSDTKDNLSNIEKNDSPVSFLLFKQAAATGWDCPRASILVMFREIKTPTFAIQTVGRILRMPFGEHFALPELNRGYLYTNYNRNEVLAGYNGTNAIGENRPAVYTSRRKANIEPIELQSTFISRADYNDLHASFELTFNEIANKQFGITVDDNDISGREKLSDKGIDTSPNLKNNLIVGAEIADYDNFVGELKDNGADEDYEMSQNDVEHLYNLLCFQIIAEQTDEAKKYAPERSYGKLKTALNVWFEQFYQAKSEYYRVIVKDLLKRNTGNSILASIIQEALEAYRPIVEAEVGKREEDKRQTIKVQIPIMETSFTDLYDELDVQKCAMSPFYIGKNYQGKQNETNFIAHLEANEKVMWWYKNGDKGSEFFAIPYTDLAGKERLFYPDWFVKTFDNRLWVIDTKGGFTADAAINDGKAEALNEWLEANNCCGGIVKNEANIWKLYDVDSEKWSDLMF